MVMFCILICDVTRRWGVFSMKVKQGEFLSLFSILRKKYANSVAVGPVELCVVLKNT